jgi:hypothetical protein
VLGSAAVVRDITTTKVHSRWLFDGHSQMIVRTPLDSTDPTDLSSGVHQSMAHKFVYIELNTYFGLSKEEISSRCANLCAQMWYAVCPVCCLSADLYDYKSCAKKSMASLLAQMGHMGAASVCKFPDRVQCTASAGAWSGRSGRHPCRMQHSLQYRKKGHNHVRIGV